jgi:hypothetical protein
MARNLNLDSDSDRAPTPRPGPTRISKPSCENHDQGIMTRSLGSEPMRISMKIMTKPGRLRPNFTDQVRVRAITHIYENHDQLETGPAQPAVRIRHRMAECQPGTSRDDSESKGGRNHTSQHSLMKYVTGIDSPVTRVDLKVTGARTPPALHRHIRVAVEVGGTSRVAVTSSSARSYRCSHTTPLRSAPHTDPGPGTRPEV